MESIVKRINDAQTICFLTGAGVSTLSGIPDFQTTDEDWTHPVPREVAISLPFFKKDPEAFWEIYRELFHSKQDAKPNIVHNWIADLERRGKDVSVITQNVDGLHSDAGSSKVFDAHGSVQQVVCMNRKCRRVFPSSDFPNYGVPQCLECGANLKPDVVLFGEQPRHMADAESAVIVSDILVVMGTGLKVFPVAALPKTRRRFRRDMPQIWMDKNKPPTRGFTFEESYVGDFADFPMR